MSFSFEGLAGIAMLALFLSAFFAMFLIIFRNTNYPCIEDEGDDNDDK